MENSICQKRVSYSTILNNGYLSDNEAFANSAVWLEPSLFSILKCSFRISGMTTKVLVEIG